MDFITRLSDPSGLKLDCLVLPVFKGDKLSETAQAIDKQSGGVLASRLKTGDIEGAAGEMLMLYDVPKVAAARVMLLGFGDKAKLDVKSYRKAMSAACKNLQAGGSTEAAFATFDETVKGATVETMTRLTVLAAQAAVFRADGLKSKTELPAKPLKRVHLASLHAATIKAANAALPAAKALANGVDFTKRLGNLPGNHATPSFLGEEAKSLSKLGIKVKVLDRPAIEKLGMGSFLSVTNGSLEPPRFIIMEYMNGGKKKPTVLVGKGVTFDTGGISIKPAGDMDHMKWDMSGAGSVLGVMRALGELKPAINVVGLVPACENMPGNRATKPGDIFTSMSGQTIEVLNTDAEGRLILCDALTYAERYEPRAVIDIATLTGACVIALGHVNAAVYASDDTLADHLIESGRSMEDRLWRMPLEEDYQEALDSNFADMANVGSRAGGSITAACFLWRFAKKYNWAHLDIAGVAYTEGKAKGATGRPVPLLVDYLLKHA